MCHSHMRHHARPWRGRHPIPAHFGSLAELVQAVREHGAGAGTILCAAKYLELPTPQSSGMPQGVWGVLVTARIPRVPCGARDGEATLSAWIVAEELPRRCATVARRAAAQARLAELERRVREYLQATGFTCQAGQYPVPVTAFWCRAHFCPPHGESAPNQWLQPAGACSSRHDAAAPSAS